MTARQSPTVRRRRLGAELRRLREEAGLTIERVAATLECSESKVSRIETGQVGAMPRDVRDMLDLYKVGPEQREALIQIARDARQKGWWHAYTDVPVVPGYVGLEVSAAAIDTFGALLVPGLLQTPEYARTVLEALLPDLSAEQIRRRVELRMARQSILNGEHPPTLRAILDEALLRRPVGGHPPAAPPPRRGGGAAQRQAPGTAVRRRRPPGHGRRLHRVPVPLTDRSRGRAPRAHHRRPVPGDRRGDGPLRRGLREALRRGAGSGRIGGADRLIGAETVTTMSQQTMPISH
jgi:transcriptional regulator with XRE-family HTH domain